MTDPPTPPSESGSRSASRSTSTSVSASEQVSASEASGSGVASASGAVPGPDRGAVTDLVMRTFRLNGIFLAIGESLSRPAGLTSARWQILGAVLRSPLPVAGIAREMGLTRQSVQRNANLLVESGLAVYVENPAHRRAKLLIPTEAGRKAIRRIAVDQHEWARRLDERIGELRLRQALQILDDVISALDPIATDPIADPIADQPTQSSRSLVDHP